MSSKLASHSIVAAAKDQIFCALGEEAVILNLKNGVYYGLDAVGSRIWAHVQEPKTVNEIRDALLNEFDVEGRLLENDLRALLEELAAEGLIEVKDETSA